MMLNTKTFAPRYFQLKLHIEAQISSGVPAAREEFPDADPSSCCENSVCLAVRIIEES
jgi:hypothetical protein